MWPFHWGTSALAPPETPEEKPLSKEQANARVWDILQQPPEARIGHHPVPPGAKVILAGAGLGATVAFGGALWWQIRRIRGADQIQHVVTRPVSTGLSALRKDPLPTPSPAPGPDRAASFGALGTLSTEPIPPNVGSKVDRPSGSVSALTRPRGPTSGLEPQDDQTARTSFASALRSPLGGGEDDAGPVKTSPDAVMMAFQAFAASVVIVAASGTLAWQILRRVLGVNNVWEFIDYIQDRGPFGRYSIRSEGASHASLDESSELDGSESPTESSKVSRWLVAQFELMGETVCQYALSWAKAVPVPSIPKGDQVPEHDQEAQDASDWFDRLSRAMEEEVQAEYRERQARRAVTLNP